MRYHWIRDRVRQGIFKVSWSAGPDNIADYFTKLQPAQRQKTFDAIFTHMLMVRGCVDTLHNSISMHSVTHTLYAPNVRSIPILETVPYKYIYAPIHECVVYSSSRKYMQNLE